MWRAGESPAGGTVSRPVVAARRAQGIARCHVPCRERCGRAGLLSDETAMMRSARLCVSNSQFSRCIQD